MRKQLKLDRTDRAFLREYVILPVLLMYDEEMHDRLEEQGKTIDDEPSPEDEPFLDEIDAMIEVERKLCKRKGDTVELFDEEQAVLVKGVRKLIKEEENWLKYLKEWEKRIKE